MVHKKRLSLRQLYVLVMFIAAGLFAPGSSVQAQSVTVPADFTVTQVAGGLVKPTTMQFAPDGRLFVTLQEGGVRVIENNSLLPAPFTSFSVNATGERGLLGIAFDPNFNSNHYIYFYYTTASAPIHNRVSRVTADGNVMLPGSETPIFDLNNLDHVSHNGGAIHFGPDGKLYIATGENVVPENAQSFANVLGKVLRINADGTIPADNPFFATTTGINQAIWARGLRNPYNFAFQPGTGRMFINDVGQAAWEEINDGIPGSNYGWPATEGPTTNPAFRAPIYAYSRSGGACAITGAAFYNPSVPHFPNDYTGDYFFGDYCAGRISRYDIATDTAQVFASNFPFGMVDVKVAVNGSVYVLVRGSSSNDGRVYRIDYVPGSGAPPLTPGLIDNIQDLLCRVRERKLPHQCSADQ